MALFIAIAALQFAYVCELEREIASERGHHILYFIVFIFDSLDFIHRIRILIPLDFLFCVCNVCDCFICMFVLDSGYM